MAATNLIIPPDAGSIPLPSNVVYIALIAQSGTDAPTATVLINTLGGEVVWTRQQAGFYTGTLEGAFIANRTICPPFSGSGVALMPLTSDGGTPFGYFAVRPSNNDNDIVLECYDDTISLAELSTYLVAQKVLVTAYVYPET